MRRRVVVTGMGVVTPIGIGIEHYWSACILGKSGVREIRSFDASNYPTRIAAEVTAANFDPRDYSEDSHIQMMGRGFQFAVAAAQMAISDSAVNIEKLDPAKTGISIGVIQELDFYVNSLCQAAFASTYSEDGQKKGIS